MSSPRLVLSFLRRHLFRLLCWLATVPLAWELARGHTRRYWEPQQELILVALILGFAALGQYGDALLNRLRKVGPVEFFDRQIGTSPLEKFLPFGDNMDFGVKLTPNQHYEYEKVDLFVTTVEFSGLKENPLAEERRFHVLLFRLGLIAMNDGDWSRARDRLEQLLDVSQAKYDPDKVYYNSGLCHLKLAQQSEDKEMQRLYKEALDRFRKAAREDPKDHVAQFYIAFIQDELGRDSKAVKSNIEALKLCPDFAPSKYNLAVSYIKRGKLEEAFQRLKSISADDEMGAATLRTGWRDPDLIPLRDKGKWQSRVRAQLRPYRPGKAPGGGV